MKYFGYKNSWKVHNVVLKKSAQFSKNIESLRHTVSFVDIFFRSAIGIIPHSAQSYVMVLMVNLANFEH